MANERETSELFKWLSKAIIVFNWFSSGVQANAIVAERINVCKCIKQTCYKTLEYDLKS